MKNKIPQALLDSVPRTMFTIGTFEEENNLVMVIKQTVPETIQEIRVQDLVPITEYLMALTCMMSNAGFEKSLELLTQGAMDWRTTHEENHS